MHGIREDLCFVTRDSCSECRLPGATAWYSKLWKALEVLTAFDCRACHGLEYQAVAPEHRFADNEYRALSVEESDAQRSFSYDPTDALMTKPIALIAFFAIVI